MKLTAMFRKHCLFYYSVYVTIVYALEYNADPADLQNKILMTTLEKRKCYFVN